MRPRRTPPPPVLELWIESVVLDGSWSQRGKDVLEAGLRAGLESELLDLLGSHAPPLVHASTRPQSPRLAGEVILPCLPAPDPETRGHTAGHAIGSDLGARLWPVEAPAGSHRGVAR